MVKWELLSSIARTHTGDDGRLRDCAALQFELVRLCRLVRERVRTSRSYGAIIGEGTEADLPPPPLLPPPRH